MATKIQLEPRPHAEYLSVRDNDSHPEDFLRFRSDEQRTANPFEIATQRTPRRDRVQILLKMLQSANVPIRKTHLMYGAGINFYQLEKHLAFLLGSGMIEELRQDEALAYRTTEKGRQFSELFA
ncbi:MAG: winged helix-turn-helix domain-containing protein [Nitrososphaera sp.]